MPFYSEGLYVGPAIGSLARCEIRALIKHFRLRKIRQSRSHVLLGTFMRRMSSDERSFFELRCQIFYPELFGDRFQQGLLRILKFKGKRHGCGSDFDISVILVF